MTHHLSVAVRAAREAGRLLKAHFEENNMIITKGEHDVVSALDYAAEKRCLENLKGEFPEYTYIAEESGMQYTSSEYTWYIDPLDGTSNYLSGNPYFSVSIALAFLEEVIVGVVYSPIAEELFTAEKGCGSFLNGVPISVRRQNDIKSAFIAAVYSASKETIQQDLKIIEVLTQSSRRVLVDFSPALNLCNIARGKLDALIDRGTEQEDHAAGSLILTEAGGKVQNYCLPTWHVTTKGIIATNGVLQGDILQLIQF